MSFFDEGDEPRTAIRSPQPRPRRPPARGGGRPPADDRTLLIRRAAAAAVVLIAIVLIVFGIKAILDNQAMQGLKDYATKVNDLVAKERLNVRDLFYKQIDLAYNSPQATQVATNIQGLVQQEGSYYREAQHWSVPSQMVGAQRQYVQAIGLRYEALGKIEGEMPAALGTGNQTPAINAIAGDMQLLNASDVIYAARVRPLILQELADAGVTDETVATSTFLADLGWLTPQTTATRVLGYVPVSLGGAPQTGSNGHELVSVGVVTSKGVSTLTPGTSSFYPLKIGSAGVTFNLSVLNSGSNDVHDVITKIFFTSASVKASCLTTQSSIPNTVPGTTYTSAIVVNPLSTCSSIYGVPLTMTAEVVPVPSETDKTNNRLKFLVEFSH